MPTMARGAHGSGIRQVAAYLVLLVFVSFFLIVGISYHSARSTDMSYLFGSMSALESHELSKYNYLDTLDADHLGLEKPGRRVIAIGDVHGMINQLHALLTKVHYNSKTDLLIHVGDIVAKGPYEGSRAVLKYMAKHNITGVRGNHDQKVIEWRARIEWAKKAQRGGSHPSTQLEKRSSLADFWKRKKTHVWNVDNLMNEDHFRIARGMSEEEYAYLLRLPLILHLPSLHTFMVHAGILPLDPRRHVNSERQPLAHIPKRIDVALPVPIPDPLAGFRRGRRREEDEDEDDGVDATKKWRTRALRNAQERSLLADVPQNANPWVLQNIRSVTDKDEVTRDNYDGTPWSEIWNTIIDRCGGFEAGGGIRRLDDVDDVDYDVDHDYDEGHRPKGDVGGWAYDAARAKHLPCYPSTVVYGHAAARGLDIKRWSKGLDSGCVYERQLTALVLTSRKSKDRSLDAIDTQSIRFGEDNFVDARLVHVECS